MPKLYINYISDYLTEIRTGLEFLDTKKQLGQQKKVFLKPNLTFPEFRKGVMTTRECLEATIVALKDFTDDITITEADSGGYNKFSIDEVFTKMGFDEFKKKYGIKLLNYTGQEYKTISLKIGIRNVKFPMPKVLIEEADTLVTLPVPKIHMNTGISLSIKNQWACLPVPSIRLKLHPFFNHVIYHINRLGKTHLSIMDGRYGLNRSGPMKGEVVDLNWVMIADDILSADIAGARLMGIDPRKIPHIRQYADYENRPVDLEGCQLNTELAEFIKEKFYLKRLWTDIPGLLCFHSSFLAWLGYHSPAAGLAHKVLYLFRERFY